jgi:hypothetical protein
MTFVTLKHVSDKQAEFTKGLVTVKEYEAQTERLCVEQVMMTHTGNASSLQCQEVGTEEEVKCLDNQDQEPNNA